MQYREYGKLGYKVSAFGMGCMRLPSSVDEKGNKTIHREEAIKMIRYAADHGVNYFDSALMYFDGDCDKLLGEALAGGYREKVKVVSKIPPGKVNSEEEFFRILDGMLEKLQTDHLDVLYTHWQTPDFGIYPLEETVEAMMKLKEQGKIRAIGASNVTADIIRGYCKYGQLDVIQEKYSLLTRRVEKQLLPTCKELGVSVQAYSPLEQGLLTGKVTMETTYPEGSTRNSNPSFQPERRSQALDMLAKWGDLTEKYDCSLAQLVIALTARMIPGLHVLCGARTPQQVMDNAGALNIKLDGADAVRMKWDVDAIS